MTTWLKARFKPGDILLLIFLLLPLLVAMPRLLGAFNDSAVGWLTLTGRLTGILGLAMMLLAAMMSIRLPHYDRWFGGLARLWVVHRFFGFAGFVLVLLHVILLAYAALPFSIDAAILRIFPPLAEWPIWAGWLALVCMVIFLGPTFGFVGRIHYQRWKRLHLFSAPAVILALLHAIPIAAETLVWWLMAVFAIGAIVWRKVLSPSLGRYRYEVAKVDTLVRGVVEISLKPVDKTMAYEAGQFIYLTPLDSNLSAGRNEEHPYTISSAPSDEYLKVGIKALGDASSAIQTVAVGSQVYVEGPYGDFYERVEPQRKQLWLAGGIGITPFVSGARDVQNRQGEVSAHLFYLANDDQRAYYLDELMTLGQQVDGLDVTAHYYRKEGPINEAFLREHCPDFAEREIYMCGPPAMIHHLRQVFKGLGIPSSRIHSEAFDFL
ncbi:ferredoxin reductase family protein [Salinispirillum sp. LH 10-3-1]|uniref:Ferredoxin reductase family protein n=1 Tax=Salinispirillum sp. LH 10-3-1 TaxID=2952525 RepID=A0AB38YDV4_9GAMM